MRRILRHSTRRVSPKVRKVLADGRDQRQQARQQAQRAVGARSTKARDYLRRTQPVLQRQTMNPPPEFRVPAVVGEGVLGLFADTHEISAEMVLDDGTMIFVRRRK